MLGSCGSSLGDIDERRFPLGQSGPFPSHAGPCRAPSSRHPSGGCRKCCARGPRNGPLAPLRSIRCGNHGHARHGAVHVAARPAPTSMVNPGPPSVRSSDRPRRGRAGFRVHHQCYPTVSSGAGNGFPPCARAASRTSSASRASERRKAGSRSIQRRTPGSRFSSTRNFAPTRAGRASRVG